MKEKKIKIKEDAMKNLTQKVALMLAICVGFTGAFPVHVSANSNVYHAPHHAIQTMFEYENYVPEDGNALYTGNLKTSELITKADFRDVAASDKVHTTKLAALDIIKGSGNQKFGSEQSLKNIEALIMLLRASGGDEALMQSLRTKFPGLADSKLMAKYPAEAFEIAKTRGILTQEENFDLYADAKEEPLLHWTMKAFAIADTSADVDNKALLSGKLSKGFQTKKGKPQNSISKIGFTRFLSELIDAYPNAIKLEKKRGHLIEIAKGSDQNGEYTEFSLQNPDAKIEKIRLRKQAKESEDFAIVDGTKLVTSKSLNIGDEIEFTLSQNEVLFASKLPKNSVKHEIVNKLQSMEGVDVIQGNVTSVMSEQIDTKERKLVRTKITLEISDNSLVAINFDEDMAQNKWLKPFVQDGSAFVSEKSIMPKDKLTLFVKGDALLYVSKGVEHTQSISGNIKQIAIDEDGKKGVITIFGFDDKLYQYDIDEKSSLLLNYYEAGLQDVVVGTTADVTALRGKVVVLKMHSYYPSQGYIPPRSRIEFGTVKNIVGNRVELVEKNKVLGADKDENRFFDVDSKTKFFKGQAQIKFTTLKKGDHIKLYFDDIYTSYPSRVEMEGKNQEISRVLKGKIQNFNQFNNVISVSDLYELKNSFWNKQKDVYQEDFKISIGSQIYEKHELYPKNLMNKEIVGREVYFVSKDNFGSKEIIKMVMKEGSERNYTETLSKHNKVDKLVTLKDRRNLNYGDGTIFIENNMLVTESAIRENANIILVGNLSDVYDDLKIAMVQEEQADYFKDFYIASLEKVDPYRVTLSNYGYAKGYQFTDFVRAEKEFRITDETVILDLTAKKRLTPQELFHGKYSKEENYEKHASKLKHKRYYVMAIVDGNEITSMVLRKKGIFEDHKIDDLISKEYLIPDELKKSLGLLYYSQGVVESKNEKWNRVSLKDSYNYQSALREWRPNTANTTIEFATTVILKNGELIDYKDIQIGDKLYVMRSNYKAVYVIVK